MPRPVVAVSTMHWPKEGARSIPFTFTFTASVGSFAADLAQEMEQGLIQIVQSVFIDNSANSAKLTLTTIIGQVPIALQCPSTSQGFFPLLLENGAAHFTVATTPAAVSVSLAFLNVAMPTATWKIT